MIRIPLQLDREGIKEREAGESGGGGGGGGSDLVSIFPSKGGYYSRQRKYGKRSTNGKGGSNEWSTVRLRFVSHMITATSYRPKNKHHHRLQLHFTLSPLCSTRP